MSELRKPADILAAQGEQAEVNQVHSLICGEDKIYVHLATLATASAIAGLHMETQEKRGRESLVAAWRQKGKIDKIMRRGRTAGITCGINLDNNVRLIGKLTFEKTDAEQRYSLLPPAADNAFAANRRKANKHVATSEVSLVCKPAAFGAQLLRVGILAAHTADSTSWREAGYGIVSETLDPDEFDDILGLVRKDDWAEDDIDYDDEPEDMHVVLPGTLNTFSITQSKIVTLPTAHFAFHEALGVPEATMAIARSNFTALTQHMQLPYELPES